MSYFLASTDDPFDFLIEVRFATQSNGDVSVWAAYDDCDRDTSVRYIKMARDHLNSLIDGDVSLIGRSDEKKNV